MSNATSLVFADEQINRLILLFRQHSLGLNMSLFSRKKINSDFLTLILFFYYLNYNSLEKVCDGQSITSPLTL